MLTRLSLVAMIFLVVTDPALAKEKLVLEAAGSDAETVARAKIEIWRVDPSGERMLAHQGGADRAVREGLDLADGSYEIYLEDQETGLIFKIDDLGKGLKIGKGKSANVDTGEFVGRIRETKDKDKTEQGAKSELLSRHKGKKSVYAVEEPAADAPGGAAPEEELHAPGELLVKFQPDTTLADRYAVMQELDAESRSRLVPLGVYRVKVSDATDLQALIQQFADDPRLKYVEMNMVVSVPEPVEEGR